VVVSEGLAPRGDSTTIDTRLEALGVLTKDTQEGDGEREMASKGEGE